MFAEAGNWHDTCSQADGGTPIQHEGQDDSYSHFRAMPLILHQHGVTVADTYQLLLQEHSNPKVLTG